jgi:uncharacterized protein
MALALDVLPGRLAVCRLDPDAPIALAPARPLSALVRRAGELTVVCAEDAAPPGGRVQGGWRALEVAGPFHLTAVTGVLAALAGALAAAGVSVFAVSTFDTDVLLVQEQVLDDAVAALRAAGHEVRWPRALSGAAPPAPRRWETPRRPGCGAPGGT